MSKNLLAKHLDFTDADLNTNRTGYMTQNQRQDFLKSMNFAQMVFRAFVVLTPILIVIEFWVEGQVFSTQQLIYVAILIGIVGLGLAYVAYSARNDTKKILDSNAVESIQGELWRKKKAVRGRSILNYEYVVGIADKEFRVNEQAYTILIEGDVYTFYFVGGKLLSAERQVGVE